MRTPRRRNPSRCGVTLVELLVVISIMMLLTVVAIPALRPAMESRQVRETTRGVSSYFSAAQIRAVETGRPCGVMLVRDPLLPFVATSLQQVEVPAPFGGTVTGSVVRVQEWTQIPSGTYWPDGAVVLKVRVRVNDFLPDTIRRGDLMQLNGQGPWFMISSDENPHPGHPGTPPPPAAAQHPTFQDFPVDATDGFINFLPSGYTTEVYPSGSGNVWVSNYVLTLTLPRAQLADTPWPNSDPSGPAGSVHAAPWSPLVPFQVYRAPVKSAVPPLQLPTATVVDLSCSGTESNWTLFSAVDNDGNTANGVQDTSGVLILFSPTGALDRAYVQNQQQYLIDPVYLMIGARERVWQAGLDPGPDDGLYNWQDIRNLWLAVNPGTGTIGTAEVYADASDPTHYDAATDTLRPSDIFASREYVRQFQISKGGR